jgi:hypothetical protein
MYYIHAIHNLIKPSDKVLDVGGAYQPFRRANYVIDVTPYEERRITNSFLLDLPEHFSRETWVEQDICDETKPFPFKDKEFDFVVCGHTLEDVRNPFYTIREMQRVGKRGFIEIPSRFFEQLYGLEYKKLCGASHHRWLIDLKINPETGKNELVFVFKNQALNIRKDLQIRKPFFNKHIFPYLNTNLEVLGILWQDEIAAKEDVKESIAGGFSFMKETVVAGKKLGKRLWDQAEPIIVKFKDLPDFKGAKNILDLESFEEKKLSIYDLNRLHNQEIQAYEEEISKRSSENNLLADTKFKNRSLSTKIIRRFKKFFGLKR